MSTKYIIDTQQGRLMLAIIIFGLGIFAGCFLGVEQSQRDYESCLNTLSEIRK